MKFEAVLLFGMNMTALAYRRLRELFSNAAMSVRYQLSPSSAGLIATVILAFFFTMWSADALGLKVSEPSNRMRYHAIPVAMSQIYYGHTHDYTGYWSLAMLFQSPIPFEEAMARARQPLENTKPYYWTADDRGLADYVSFAFRLFGPSIPSLFYFWFVLLGASGCAALIRFRHEPQGLALIACAMIGIGATLPAFARSASASFAEASIHISESRMFDVLGAIAATHILLVMYRPRVVPKLLDGICLVLQVGLLAALIHARSSVAWLFIAILLSGGTIAAVRWRSHGRGAGIRVLIPCAMLLTGWLGVFVYQRLTFNEAYFHEIGPRTFWHNVLMGMAFEPSLARQFNLSGIEDGKAIDAVLRDMNLRHDARLTPDWNRTTMLNSLGGHNAFDWKTYEQVTKELVLRTLLTEPHRAVLLYLWYKPKSVAATLSCNFLGIAKTCPSHSPLMLHKFGKPSPIAPWGFAGLALISACFLAMARRQTPNRLEAQPDLWPSIVWPLLVFIVLGLAPSILIYPAVPQLGGTAVFLFTLVVFSICIALASLLDKRFAPAIVRIGRPR